MSALLPPHHVRFSQSDEVNSGKMQDYMNEKLFESVKKIVAEQLSVEPEKVTPEASFANDLGADSLDTVELVMSLEEEFGLEIPDEAAEQLDTVGKAVEYIAQHTQALA